MTALHERLHFDTAHGAVLDADRRYVLLRADVLMGLFERLAPDARADALQAFAESVATQGADSVRAYVEACGTDALPATMERAAASLGWGVWHLQPSAAATGGAPRALSLEVENSPFAMASNASAAPTCHAIAGMLEAIAGALWQMPAVARETRCAAVHGGSRCEFIATPNDRLIPTPNEDRNRAVSHGHLPA